MPTCVSRGYAVGGEVADLEAAGLGQETHLDDELSAVLVEELLSSEYLAREGGEQTDDFSLELGVVGESGEELFVSGVQERWVTARYARIAQTGTAARAALRGRAGVCSRTCRRRRTVDSTAPTCLLVVRADPSAALLTISITNECIRSA